MSDLRKKAKKDFNERREAKKEYYEQMAEKKADLSNQLYTQASKMASIIPFGQPIHIGHHSEKWDRNYREKIHNKYGKAFKESDKAEYYKEKAKTIGSGGIMSDDPEAIIKLKEKIAKFKENIEFFKKMNREMRKYKTFEKALEHFKNLEDKETAVLMVKHLTFRESIYANPPEAINRYYFDTSSDNQEVKRLEKRLNWMIREENTEAIDFVINEIEVKEEDGRINVYFPYKPDEETRKKIKSYPLSMKWSRFNGCWTRKKTQSTGKYFLEDLKKLLMSL